MEEEYRNGSDSMKWDQNVPAQRRRSLSEGEIGANDNWPREVAGEGRRDE